LGLESYASDLNPVAVLINKAMIEIPPKFAGRPPVNPEAHTGQMALGQQWRSAQGLAEDVRYYGQWMRDEAEKRIGHLYPKIEITAEIVRERPDLKRYMGQKLTVIAWLWARTVKSPNPAFAQVDVPLVSSFMLSTKPGKEAYVEPVLGGDSYNFTIKMGKPKDLEAAKNGTKLARGANFRCIMSETPIAPDHIYGEANSGRMSARLMAIVAEGDRERIYIAPTPEHETIGLQAQPEWQPDIAMPGNPRWFSPPLYGLKTFGDLFTPRQLVALTTLSGLVQEAHERVRHDALAAGLPNNERGLDSGGNGAAAYADAVAVYLAFAFDKLSTTCNTICTWQTDPTRLVAAFSRQAIPMTWDYAEANAFGGAAGDYHFPVLSVIEVMHRLPGVSSGSASQEDAQRETGHRSVLISTDPPYYDNIGYADLSDFFYVWLRRSLRPIFPALFATLAVPKAEELVATPYRHGSKEKAEKFFLNGMTQAMRRLGQQAHPAFPVTIYYAFKQSESDGANGAASTGWETFLDAVISAGFGISGTWPMRTELTVALKKTISALASSIVLVCRPLAIDAPIVTRREFLAALKDELPVALAHLQGANIAPVDLAQASIGPGMAVFTRYGKVLDATGKALMVREALALINAILDEVLTEQEGDFDADTRWALAWFEQYGFGDGEYGVAETLSTAKNTSVGGMVTAGLLASRAGKVRLLRPDELPVGWDPNTDERLTVWEMVHHLVRALDQGELAAAELAAEIGVRAEIARELAYRLYAICERKKRAAEALAYNSLVQSWPEMMRLAREQHTTEVTQTNLFEGA
jgi:putative DNA methylase